MDGNDSRGRPNADLLDKDLGATFLEMLKGYRKTWASQEKQCVCKIEMSKKKHEAWKGQKEMLKLKSVTEVKNPLKGFKSKFEQAKESLDLRKRQLKRSGLRNRKGLKEWE